MANSTYTALFGTRTTLTNVSALSTLAPTHEVVTLFATNAAGVVSTTVSTVSVATVTLGVPPGYSSASSNRFGVTWTVVVSFVHFFWTFMFLSWTDIIVI